MSAISADFFEPDGPDHLAGSVLRSLGGRLGTRASWSFIKTLLWSTVTFGIGPLLVWPAALRRLISDERSQFLHLAEWMRLRSGNPKAFELVEAAGRIRASELLSLGPQLVAVFVVVIFAVTIGRLHIFSSADAPLHEVFSLIMASTFNFGRLYEHPIQSNQLFLLWTAGLTAAYVLHWLQLLAHVSNVRRAVRVFNDLAITEGLPPVREPGGVGLRPIWLTAALIMMTASALWAIPMMLAGGMQRRYAVVTGPALRATVADRLRDLLLIRRPVMRMPTMIALPRRCPNEICRSPMSRIANFCPRCGVHVGPEIDELA